jgi:hypothetical protein
MVEVNSDQPLQFGDEVHPPDGPQTRDEVVE